MPLATLPVGKGEAYGMCLWQRASDDALFAFVVMKDGRIDQLAFDLSGAAPTAKVVRSMKLATQSEGCVADDRTGILYVAEEDIGVWTFPADPASGSTATAFAKVDKKILFDDAEGLALAATGDTGGYLVVSSQGDNGYSLYRLADASFAGRFSINGGAIDGTSETDGIELLLGDFGADYPAAYSSRRMATTAPKRRISNMPHGQMWSARSDCVDKSVAPQEKQDHDHRSPAHQWHTRKDIAHQIATFTRARCIKSIGSKQRIG